MHLLVSIFHTHTEVDGKINKCNITNAQQWMMQRYSLESNMVGR